MALRYYENYDDDQIAAVLGCAVGTVRSHISRAIASLRHTEPQLVRRPTLPQREGL